MVQVTHTAGGIWKKLRSSIGAGPATSTIVDTLPLTSFRSLDYIIVVSNTAQDKARKIHLSIVQENSGLKSTVYGKMGALKFAVSEAINGALCEVTVTNNEAFSVNVSIAKLVLT